MKTDIWMPFYIADYLADTQHLSAEEHGAYMLLLMHAWRRAGKVPMIDQQLAIICRISLERWLEIKPVILEFFRIEDGYLIQDRLLEEYNSAQVRKIASQSNGKRGGNPLFKKGRHNPYYNPIDNLEDNQTHNQKITDEISSSPSPSPSPSPSQSESEENTLSGKPDEKAALKQNAREVLSFLNTKTGRLYRPVEANLGLIEARLKDGIGFQDLKSLVAKKCREWLPDEKMSAYLRPATLFNKTKCEQYVGELYREDVPHGV